MDGQSLDSLTAAVAPVVMVSAAGLLFNGVQAKNLHLSDRIRALAAEMRHPELTPTRRTQVLGQLALFHTRIRLSQWSLDCIYLAILCFILTSLLLASTLWIGPPVLPALITAVFLLGVAVLVVALGLEFVEMAIALRTIDIEIRGALQDAAPPDAGAATDGERSPDVDRGGSQSRCEAALQGGPHPGWRVVAEAGGRGGHRRITDLRHVLTRSATGVGRRYRSP